MAHGVQWLRIADRSLLDVLKSVYYYNEYRIISPVYLPPVLKFCQRRKHKTMGQFKNLQTAKVSDTGMFYESLLAMTAAGAF